MDILGAFRSTLKKFRKFRNGNRKKQNFVGKPEVVAFSKN